MLSRTYPLALAKAANALTRLSIDPRMLCCSAAPGVVALFEAASKQYMSHSDRHGCGGFTIECKHIGRVAR
jgi:hypothetical protein